MPKKPKYERVDIQYRKEHEPMFLSHLRGTLGMLGQVAEVTERDPRTSMVLIYQLTWSAGGDALVVKGNINQPSDLRGFLSALAAVLSTGNKAI